MSLLYYFLFGEVVDTGVKKVYCEKESSGLARNLVQAEGVFGDVCGVECGQQKNFGLNRLQ